MTDNLTNTDERIQFVAVEAGSYIENGVLSCGASDAESDSVRHYFILQATVDGPDPEGWGVYLEFDDQSNGGYERLKAVRLNGLELTLVLKEGNDRYPDLKQIVVDLSALAEPEAAELVDAVEECIARSSLSVERDNAA